MAFTIIVLICAAVALITGGSINNLKSIRFKYPWLVLAAVVIKLVTNSGFRHTLGLPDPLAPKLYILSLALVAVFVLLNLRLRGLVLIGLGLLSNLLVIYANSGYMPLKREYFEIIASPEELALIKQGLPAYNYVATGPDTVFYYLSDIFLMPHWIFITRVFSIGDVLITIGGCLFVWRCLKKPAGLS